MALININKGNKVMVRLTANADLVTVANSTANSDIGYVGNDPVRGAEIGHLMWSTPTNIKISRGSNLIMTLTGSGNLPFSDYGWKLNEFPQATMNVTITDTNSSVVIVLHKIYDGGQNPDINQPGS